MVGEEEEVGSAAYAGHVGAGAGAGAEQVEQVEQIEQTAAEQAVEWEPASEDEE